MHPNNDGLGQACKLQDGLHHEWSSFSHPYPRLKGICMCTYDRRTRTECLRTQNQREAERKNYIVHTK